MSNTEVQKVKPEETSTLEKQILVDFKNGKVTFKQKPLSLERMSETMQEIVKLRAFMETRVKENVTPLRSVPEEHLPLIAKFTHESDRTLSALARHIHSALQPDDLEAELETPASKGASQLPLDVIENAILSIADRKNYGVDWLGKTNASLSIWRWELKEQRMDWLPKGVREKLEARISERHQAKADLQLLYGSLSQPEKDNLTKGIKKGKGDGSNVIVLDFADGHSNENSSTVDKPENEEPNADTSKVGRQRKEKPLDPDRIAKEKEKAERKAAKAERERKEREAQNKSRSIMTAFFNKPKATNNKFQIVEPSKGIVSPSKPEPSSSKSDFEKIFKPFVIKKDASVAPINYFEWRKQSKEVIVIDQDIPLQASYNLGRSSEIDESSKPEEVLEQHRKAVPEEFCLPNRMRNASSNWKSPAQYYVKDIMSQLSEAEVMGDTATVRRLHALLCDRTRIPVKVLIFHEDTRPGYFGTFTKSSSTIGPRNPLAKDAVSFDYSYDSGEEWEEEEEGGEDVVSNDGSEDENGEVDSDLDSWLVQDDEDIDPGTPISERQGSPLISVPQLPTIDSTKKRKTTTSEKKETKKRKIIPLMPFTKGPIYEDEIGHCDSDLLMQYRIQLFNDTPFPIDPFTFISTPINREVGSSNKPPFAVPAPPVHVAHNGPSTSSGTISTSMDSVTTLPVKRKAIAAVKTPFPDALMPFLADKVSTLATGNLSWLIESLYQDLKAHKVKKVSIDAKVREVVEKCPSKKIWVVKGDILTSIGRPIVSTANVG